MIPEIVKGSISVEHCSTRIIYINEDGEYDIYKDDLSTEDGWITLDCISTQIQSSLIEVLYDQGLEGWIYTYNNYNDDKWYLTGKTCGFA